MNQIPAIANLLGVEIGEEFQIERDGLYIYRFRENGVQRRRCESIYWADADATLRKLINGTAKIAREAWKPKCGDKYWTIECLDTSMYNGKYVETPCISEYEFHKTDIGMYRIALGLCFRTKEEAEAAIPLVEVKVKRVLDGGKWEEEDDGE